MSRQPVWMHARNMLRFGRDLSPVAYGAFYELIDAVAAAGGSMPLPDNQTMAGLAGVSPRRWGRMRRAVLAGFIVKGDTIRLRRSLARLDDPYGGAGP